MGFGQFKDMASGAAESHGDQIGEGMDKAGDVVDEKIGGRFGSRIDAGVDQAKEAIGIQDQAAEAQADQGSAEQGGYGEQHGQSGYGQESEGGYGDQQSEVGYQG